MMVGLLVVLNYYSDIPSTRRSKIDSNTILIKVKTDGWIVRTKSKVWIWLFLVCTEFKDLLLITWIQFLLHRNQILMVNTIWLNFGYFRNISCFAQRQNYWILGSDFAQRKNWICYLLFFWTCQDTELKNYIFLS